MNYLKEETMNALRLLDLRAFFFDMDGVLYNSMPYHAKAWVYAFEKANLKFDEYNAYLHEGMTGFSTIDEIFRTQLRRAATEEECKTIYKIKTDHFESFGHAEEVEHVGDVLKYVKNHGLERFIVTGSGQLSLFEKIEESFPSIFTRDKMVTAFDVKKGKPDPEPYLMALKKGNLNDKQAIVVENAPLGVRAGVAANIFTVAVNTGILKDEELWREGANIVFPSMSAFYETLPEIIRLAKK